MVDLSGIQDYIPPIAQALGIEPATVLLLAGLTVMFANLFAKLIPDDRTGFLGFVRKICRFIGFAASNRIASGLTVNEIARTTVPIIEHIGEVQEQMESKLEGFGTEIVQAFPGVSKGPGRDPVTGKFLKKGDE